MNQILISEKIYVTPELRRKKKKYKMIFCISICAVICLLLYYIYGEYDKDKSESVSKSILSSFLDQQKVVVEDTTVRNVINDVLIISLDREENNSEEEEEEISSQTTSYVAEDGIEYSSEAILRIDSLGIDYPVLSDTSDELLKISLNKYWGPKPNEVGNYCIVGHNYGNSKMFSKLYQMEIGDTAVLTDLNNRSITYEAYDIFITEPTDVSCTSQLTAGRKEITLITCSNYGKQRRIIKCREVK